MVVVTSDQIPGYEIKEVKGIVNGNIVKAKHIGRDIGAGFKTLIGGEINAYSELLTESRNIAIERMIKSAEAEGANGIIGFRLGSSMVMAGASEIFAYGTAVVIEKL